MLVHGGVFICLKHIRYDEWKTLVSTIDCTKKWINISKKEQVNPTSPHTLWFFYDLQKKKWIPDINIVSRGSCDGGGDVQSVPVSSSVQTPVVQTITMNIQSIIPPSSLASRVYDPTHFVKVGSLVVKKNFKNFNQKRLYPKE